MQQNRPYLNMQSPSYPDKFLQVKKILNSAYERAQGIIRKHEDELHTLAKELLDKETLTGKQIKDLLASYPAAARQAAENMTRAIKEGPPKGII